MNHSIVRKGGNVKRFHVHALIGEQTVAAHSWGVAAILLEICEPSLGLIKAALYHDIFEYATGDVPYTAKRDHPEIKEALEIAEKTIAQRMEIDVMWNLSHTEESLLKIADMLELCYFCMEQIKLGNMFMVEIFDTGRSFLNSMLRNNEAPKAAEMLMELVNERNYYVR